MSVVPAHFAPTGAAAVCSALVLTPAAPGVLVVPAALAVLVILPGWVMTAPIAMDTLGRLVVTVALSLSTTLVVSTLLMYAGIWSWQGSLLLVAAVTLTVQLLPVARQRVWPLVWSCVRRAR